MSFPKNLPQNVSYIVNILIADVKVNPMIARYILVYIEFQEHIYIFLKKNQI